MLTITIPTPCNEDWNRMTPDKTGRHCSACAKSVVDFTGMSDEEVKYFFLNKKEDERVCGRFKQTQLHRIVIELPQNIFNIQMPLWKKFLAACLVVFSTTLFSCETKINGKMETGTETCDVAGLIDISPDTTTIPVPPPPPPPPFDGTIGVVFAVPELLTGDVEVVELKSTLPVDSVMVVPIKDTIFKGLIEEDLTINLPVTPAKTKNPPEADSINCKTIKNYH
jgi:hypothetical protein